MVCFCDVPREGIEPSLGRPNTILSRARLPVPPSRLFYYEI